MKRNGCLKIFALCAGILGLLFTGLCLWLRGWGDSTFTEGQATRIQYFEAPPLVAVHINSPPRVLVIRNIEDRNYEEMHQWLNPENSEIESISVDGSSIYNRWSNWLENRDVLQMGVHGLAKKPHYQFVNGKLAMGVGTEDFPPHSFTMMSEQDFATLRRDNPVLDKEVWGRVTYSTHSRTYIRNKPTGYSGP